MSDTRDMGAIGDKPSGNGSKWLKALLFAVGLLALIILTRMMGFAENLDQLRAWIDSKGAWGPVVYVLVYILGVFTVMPSTAMILIGGALFGSVLGTVVVSFASASGAALAFLSSRYIARDTISAWLKKYEKFRKLDSLTDRHGKVVVALSRLVPVFPDHVVNFSFGLTSIGFWTYLFWSWLCMLPGTIVLVVGADAVSSAIISGRMPWALLAAGVGVMVVLVFLIRWLQQRLSDQDQVSESQ